MLSKLSLVLACGVLASSFSMNAQASPFSSVRPQPTAPVITLARDGCGLGPLGGVRLHSQLHSVPRGRRSSGTGSRCATVRATRRCNAGRLSVRLLSQPVR